MNELERKKTISEQLFHLEGCIKLIQTSLDIAKKEWDCYDSIGESFTNMEYLLISALNQNRILTNSPYHAKNKMFREQVIEEYKEKEKSND